MRKMPQIEWDEQSGAGRNARRELPALAAAYFAYVRELLAQDPPPAGLHRVRLATKRLRYTLELFRPCYGPALQRRLEQLRQVQQMLGDLNDSVASWALLRHAMGPSAQRARAGKFLEQRAARQAREFHQHWAQVFDAPGRELWWTRYLSRNARG